MYKCIAIAATAFFLFLLWIIYLANTGASSVFFGFIRSIPYGDKWGHFGLFGALTFLTIVASKFRYFCIGKLRIYFSTVVVALFVFAEELSQAFIPSRTFDLVDLTADFFGIIVATVIASLASKYLKKHHSSKQYKNTSI